jgi:hypothetical protein
MGNETKAASDRASRALLASNLRSYNAWRRGTAGYQMPHPVDIGRWLDTAADLLDTNRVSWGRDAWEKKQT